MSISNEEFNYLITLQKEFEGNQEISLGPPPVSWTRSLVGVSQREFFLLDYRRGSIEFSKFTLNNRYRTAIVLLRFDSSGIHRNPPERGGELFQGPHFHIYDEEFDDRVAYPISELKLSETFSPEEAISKFLDYINVTNIPAIQISL